MDTFQSFTWASLTFSVWTEMHGCSSEWCLGHQSRGEGGVFILLRFGGPGEQSLRGDRASEAGSLYSSAPLELPPTYAALHRAGPSQPPPSSTPGFTYPMNSQPCTTASSQHSCQHPHSCSQPPSIVLGPRTSSCSEDTLLGPPSPTGCLSPSFYESVGL